MNNTNKIFLCSNIEEREILEKLFTFFKNGFSKEKLKIIPGVFFTVDPEI